MVVLVAPHQRFHRSYLAAADEFLTEGGERYAGTLSRPAGPGHPAVELTRERLEAPVAFADLTAYLVGQQQEDAPRAPGFVAATERWITHHEGSAEYLGRISLRHTLTPLLLTWGGHIGYAVRPSARGRGYATAALAAMLPVCRARGIDPVLVTCDVDNMASRRVIERNGGLYEDTREGKRRYWVPTGSGLGLARDEQAVADR